MKTISLFRLLLILTSPGYGPTPTVRKRAARHRDQDMASTPDTAAHATV